MTSELRKTVAPHASSNYIFTHPHQADPACTRPPQTWAGLQAQLTCIAFPVPVNVQDNVKTELGPGSSACHGQLAL